MSAGTKVPAPAGGAAPAAEGQPLHLFVKHFLAAYPGRSAIMIGLLGLAGLLEGVGIATLVPILEVAESGGTPQSALGRFVASTLESAGIEASLGPLLLLVVVTMTVKAFLLWLSNRQVGFTVAHVTRDLRLRMIRALLKARWGYYGSRATGSFANTVSTEALRAAFAYREICSFIAALFQITTYVIIATLISWQIAVLALVSGTLLAWLLQGFVRMSRAAGLEQTRLSKSLTGRLVDVLQGIKPIKAMAREELVLPLLEEETEGLNQAQRKQVLASAGRRLFQEPILTGMLALTLYFLLEVSGQPFSSGLVLAFIFYRLMQHVNTLQGKIQAVVTGESAFWSLWEQISEAEDAAEDTEAGGETKLPERAASISVSGVTFGYIPGKPVLEDLDLDIPAGSFIAISGESGSGKTTLADLVLGFHTPQWGTVTIDGKDLQELSLRDWRRQIGYVPQELLLFNQSILMNVTLGDPDLSRNDVERALQQAGAWGFVSEREGGMDAFVGEQGGMLSGGQRQRIAIARALVHRPSLLILDEVTTALDPVTEAEICNTLTDLAGEVTILSISHQPAMREAASRSYLMKAGSLELMATADPPSGIPS